MKLAEVAGWKVHPKDRFIVIPPNSPHSVQPLSNIPDYFNDLNAVHELEKVLRGHAQISAYVWELERLTHWKPDYREGGDGKQYISPAAYYCTTHATAAQRAEAIGLTLKLW